MVKKKKGTTFLYRTSEDDLLLVGEYARVFGISRGRLIREAVQDFMVRNRGVYDGLRGGGLVAVKQRGGRIAIVEKGEYDRISSDIE
jgi:hypothetical protein